MTCVSIANIEEYTPLVYTSIVGLVCLSISGLLRSPRWAYFNARDYEGDDAQGF